MTEGKNFQRSPARICNIKEIIEGKYIKKEGWEPSFIITEYNKLFRVNIIGVVVSKDNNGFIIDDGTGKIQIRSFVNNINSKIGELVKIIGKPRQFNNEIFINSEIIKPIKNIKWVDYRKKELSLRHKQKIIETEDYIDDKKTKQPEISKKSEETIIKETAQTLSKTETIIGLIDKFDSGDGANIEDIIKESGFSDAEIIIKNLTEEGEIFQIKPGKLKVM